MITVQHNMQAMNAYRQFGLVGSNQAKSMEKLSSGYKINRAADDAAGLAISEKMRRQIRGLNQGAANIQDGISLVQVADGALAEVDDLLHRANQLAVQSANGTNSDEDRGYLQLEVDQIIKEINRIGSTTTFNGIHIFDKEEIENKIGKITQLVTSPSADSGKLSEAFDIGGNFYTGATINFSAVTDKNVDQLKGAYFTFNCTAGCTEAFKFVLKNDGTPSEFDATTAGRTDTHVFYVDIGGCSSGTDVVDRIYSIASSVTPVSVDASTDAVATAVGGKAVSHTNVLAKSGSTLSIISGNGYSYSAAAAEKVFSGRTGRVGGVDCSSLTNIYTPEPIFSIPIQCSSNVDDKEEIHTRVMNAEFIGVEPLDISTQAGAEHAIDKVKFGLKNIAELRSDLGAKQNRLEHSYNSNLNTAENEAAAESIIRDTDMAKEMVNLSINNILSQAGISMMSQANQANAGVMSMLQ